MGRKCSRASVSPWQKKVRRKPRARSRAPAEEKRERLAGTAGESEKFAPAPAKSEKFELSTVWACLARGACAKAMVGRASFRAVVGHMGTASVGRVLLVLGLLLLSPAACGTGEPSADGDGSGSRAGGDDEDQQHGSGGRRSSGDDGPGSGSSSSTEDDGSKGGGSSSDDGSKGGGSSSDGGSRSGDDGDSSAGGSQSGKGGSSASGNKTGVWDKGRFNESVFGD